ncbi:MAG: carboxymuconolactone decarboxylase family protein [Solibacillus sp.]
MSTPFQQLLAFNNEVEQNWTALGECLEQDGFLPATLKEQVRRVLAQQNGCEYCKAKGKPNSSHYDEKIAICTAFTEAFLQSRGQTSPNVTAVLKDYLTKEEIGELLAFICFTTASQYFGALHQLQPSE